MAFNKYNILLLSVLASNICFASDSLPNQETADKEEFYQTDVGSIVRINSLKSDIFSSVNTVKNTVNTFEKSFYINIKNTIANIPNLKIEYVNSSLRGNNQYNDGLSSKSSALDVDLQHADLVSYYTLNGIENVNLDLGFGLRQYIGEVSLSESTNTSTDSINSTIPLSYVDLSYSLSDYSKVGAYIKESQLANDNIQDSAIYYSAHLNSSDNLNFIASYSLSNFSLDEKTELLTNDYSNFTSEGINLQLVYAY